MLGRTLASVVALLGGILVGLAGAISLVFAVATRTGVAQAPGGALSVPLALVAVLLGILVAALARSGAWTFWRPRLGSAIVLVVLGIIAIWMLAGDLLASVGAFLTVLGGLGVALEGWLRPPLFSRRWFRRGLW